MKITIDTKEDKHELEKIIKLLQHIVGDTTSSYAAAQPSYAATQNDLPGSYLDLPSVPEQSAPKESPAGLMNIFGDDIPTSLNPPAEEKVNEDEPMESIRIIDF